MLIKNTFTNLRNSANQTETKAHPSFSSNNKFGIEIELEGAPSNIWQHNFRYWRAIVESSLRNNGIEFVLKRPLNGDALHRAINELYGNEMFQACQVHWRGGIHVHIDVRNWDQFKLAAFVKRYYRYETKIFEDFGHDRWHSNFCIPLKNQYQMLHLALGGRVNRLAGDCNKYSALNFRPMRELGSIEWRAAASTQSIETMRAMIKTFCGFINDADDYVALSPEQQKEYDKRYFTKMECLALDWLGRGLEGTERGEQPRPRRQPQQQERLMPVPNWFAAEQERIVPVPEENTPTPIRHVTSIENLDEEGWSNLGRETFVPVEGGTNGGYWSIQRYHDGMEEWIETSARVASPGDAETPAEELNTTEESNVTEESNTEDPFSATDWSRVAYSSTANWTVESSVVSPLWAPVAPVISRERFIPATPEGREAYYSIQEFVTADQEWVEVSTREEPEEVAHGTIRHRQSSNQFLDHAIPEIYHADTDEWVRV